MSLEQNALSRAESGHSTSGNCCCHRAQGTMSVRMPSTKCEIGTGNSCTLLPASWTIAAYLETFPARAAFKIFKGFCTTSRIRAWLLCLKRPTFLSCSCNIASSMLNAFNAMRCTTSHARKFCHVCEYRPRVKGPIASDTIVDSCYYTDLKLYVRMKGYL